MDGDETNNDCNTALAQLQSNSELFWNDHPSYDPHIELKEEMAEEDFVAASHSNDGEASLWPDGPPIVDGVNFFKVIEVRGFQIKCLCLSCEGNKVISASTKSLTNLRTHLKRVHPQKMMELDHYKNFYSPSKRRRSRGYPHSFSEPLTKVFRPAQLTAQNGTCKNIAPPIEAEELPSSEVDKAISTFIIKGMHPPSTVDQPEFKELLMKCNPLLAIPSAHKLTLQLRAAKKLMLETLKARLSQAEYICNTVDVWGEEERCYITITAHWIDDALQRQSAFLACSRCQKPISKNIIPVISDVHHEFSFPTSKIVATATDNMADYTPSLRKLHVNPLFFSIREESLEQREEDYADYVVREVMELNHPGVPNSESVPGDTKDTFQTFSLSSIDHSSSVISSSSSSSSTSNFSTTLDALMFPNRVRCSTNTLGLVLTTDVEEALNFQDFTDVYMSALVDCSILWSRAEQSQFAEVVALRLGDRQLRKPCPTRVKSLHDSVGDIVASKDIINVLALELGLSTFGSDQIEFLEEYLATLKPIVDGIERLEGSDGHSFYGELLPTLLMVNSYLDDVREKDLKFCMPLLNAITAGFRRRFAAFLSLDTSANDAMLATISHPFFKLRWLGISAATNSPNTIDRMQSLFLQTVVKLNKPRYAQADSGGKHKSSGGASNSWFKFADDLSKSPTADPLEIEGKCFLQDADNTLACLHKYPAVKKLFLRYNTALSSSAPVEKLIPFARIKHAFRQPNLSDDLFGDLLLLQANRAF